ncbi:MAG: site-specific integrase [Candidatus Babeliaceae bacterium]|nr:site-specific integrase [Candidatus Babeliaceae bacterium]
MKSTQVTLKSTRQLGFEQALQLKKEAVWKNLGEITVKQAVTEWLRTLKSITAKNYISGIKQLSKLKLIDLKLTLQMFALINHDAVIDQIKTLPAFSECTKQARAACYISFTRFLSRRTQGIIPKATPSREGVSKTFYRTRDKISTEAMTRAQWTDFLEQLSSINERDCLIAKVILQGGKRLSEVLSLTTDKIDWAKREITFKQSKTKGYEKETVITYPQHLLEELKAYIADRQGLVFVTRNCRPIMPNQLAMTFEKAGILSDVPFKVTPHVLRASAITFLKLSGYSDSDIMKISGHASSAMVNAYDKSDRALNISKKVSLV